jgi:hypothetical protein
VNVVADPRHGARHVVIERDRRGQRAGAGAGGEKILMRAEIVEAIDLGIAADVQRRVRAGDQERSREAAGSGRLLRFAPRAAGRA